MTTVQNSQRIATAKGTRRVGSITSAERRQLIKVVYSVCDNENVVTPIFIFPKKFFVSILLLVDHKVASEKQLHLAVLYKQQVLY